MPPAPPASRRARYASDPHRLSVRISPSGPVEGDLDVVPGEADQAARGVARLEDQRRPASVPTSAARKARFFRDASSRRRRLRARRSTRRHGRPWRPPPSPAGRSRETRADTKRAATSTRAMVSSNSASVSPGVRRSRRRPVRGRACLGQPLDEPRVHGSRVRSAHPAQDPVASALERDVQVWRDDRTEPAITSTSSGVK